jgi:hypothetical protein
MNFTEACNTLDIPTENRNPINLDIVKKQYRRKALQYHPDKNKSETASAEFILIKEAYHYLSNTSDNGISSDNINYANELFSFLRQSLSASNENLMQNKVFQIILTKIIECCEAKALDLLEKLDKNVLVKINETFKTYADVFHFSDGFLKSVQEIVVKKIQKDECVILNPFLDDLWENNLYRMVEKGGTFLIPLWHHELIYDNSGCDLYVKIIPVLPDNVKIDETKDAYVINNEDIKKQIDFYTRRLKDLNDTLLDPDDNLTDADRKEIAKILTKTIEIQQDLQDCTLDKYFF